MKTTFSFLLPFVSIFSQSNFANAIPSFECLYNTDPNKPAFDVLIDGNLSTARVFFENAEVENGSLICKDDSIGFDFGRQYSCVSLNQEDFPFYKVKVFKNIYGVYFVEVARLSYTGDSLLPLTEITCNQV